MGVANTMKINELLFDYLEANEKSGFKPKKIEASKTFTEMFKGYPKVAKWLQNHTSEFDIAGDSDLLNAKEMLKNGESQENVIEYLRYKTKTLYGESEENPQIPQINPLKSHDEHEEYKRGRLTRASEVMAQVGKDGKPRYSQAAYDTWMKNGAKIDELVDLIIDLINPFNQIKAVLDDAYKAFQNDWVNLNAAKKNKYIRQMEKGYKDLEKLLYQHNFFEIVRKAGVMKRSKMTRLKYDTALYNELIRKIDFINDTYKASVDIIKKMKMSDAQRAAASKASGRMRERWGM